MDARVLDSEQGRLDFLVQRDGPAAAVEWARRTMGIYRRAVLDKRHFASKGEYRRLFVESYCEFKRWLTAMSASRDRDGTA
ncbi:MAG TPA: hypothetical protein VLB72_11785 [Burkholderiales bacterium]|nr:hypothetical protein [Burkholderiales bacterium]